MSTKITAGLSAIFFSAVFSLNVQAQGQMTNGSDQKTNNTETTSTPASTGANAKGNTTPDSDATQTKAASATIKTTVTGTTTTTGSANSTNEGGTSSTNTDDNKSKSKTGTTATTDKSSSTATVAANGGAKDFTGISVSPSTLHFSLEPGTTRTMEVKLTNDTKKKFTFQANFSDFSMGKNGNPIGVKPGESKFTLSSWTTISPSYFEVMPGETKKISVTLNVPSGEEANHAAWTVLMLDQVTERAPLTANGNGNTVALGITPSMGFGIYLYQNPPGLHTDKVEIGTFNYNDSTKAGKHALQMHATNKGDGIGFCTTYVEVTNLATGKQDKLRQQKFTILPGFDREFSYEIPADLPKGKYSAVGVVDTGNPDQVTAAELEFKID